MLNQVKLFLISSGERLKKTGFFHVFGSSVINKIISFLSGIILVRLISKSDYGVYTYAQNIYGFFFILSGIGMASATLQICSESDNRSNRLDIYSYGSKIGLRINFLLAILMLTVAAIFKLPIKGANSLLAAFSCLPLFSFSLEQRMTWLRAELRNREYSYANSFHSFFSFLFSVILAVLLGSYGLILASYLSAIAVIVFLSLCFKVPFPKTGVHLDIGTKKGMWGIGIISVMNNGLSSLMYLLDIFVIGLFIPDETVIASYKIATTIPSALYFIPTSILLYVYPYFARNKDNRTWTIGKYKILTLSSAAINFSAALILVLLSGFIVPFLFGKQYADAIPCFIILCISFAFSGTFRIVAGNLLVTQRKLKFNLFVAVFSSAFNTVMNVILVLKWGSIGAALATLLTVILTSILNTSYLLHVYNKLPSDPYPTQQS